MINIQTTTRRCGALTRVRLQFYAEAILSKKGPLAKVWLAAHYERKLSKAQTLQTDIGQSASEFRLVRLRMES